jgi:restriction endonuclease S subunit
VLDAPRNRKLFEAKEKLVIQEVRNISLKKRLVATYDDQKFYCLQTTNVIILRSGNKLTLKFILGLLNSSACNFFFRTRFPGNNHIPSNQLSQIPIPTSTKPQHDRVAQLVTQLLDAHQNLAAAMTDRKKTYYLAKTEALDRKIDALVYKMYGLEVSEVALIESSEGSKISVS